MKPLSPTSRAARSLVLYAISMVLVSAANFLIVPLLVHALDRDEFSTWALLEPLALAAIPIAGLGIHLGLMHQGRSSALSLAHAINHLFGAYALSVGIASIIVAVTAIASGNPPFLAMLIGAVVLVEGLLLFAVTIFRGQGRPLAFAAMEGGRAAAVLAVMAVLVIGWPHAVTLPVYLSVRVGAALLALAAGVRAIRPKLFPSWQNVMSAVKYGGPIVAAAMLVSMLTNFDRYALFWIGAGSVVTDYTTHSKLAQTIGLATAPFFMWFAPLVMRRLASGADAHGFFIGATSSVIVLTTLASGSLWLAAPFIWPWIFPSVPYDQILFGVMLAGAAAFALGNTFSIGSLQGGKTHHALLVTASSMSIGVGAALLMGWFVGPDGVALGRATGMAAYTVLFATATALSLKINYPWGKYFTYSALCITVAVVLSSIDRSASLALTVASVMIFVAVCLVVALALWTKEARITLISLRNSAQDSSNGL